MSWRGRTEGVDYVIGLARNARLEAGIARQMRRSRSRAAVTGWKSRRFRDFRHRTRDSWSRARRVIGKAEALPGRGDAENRVKDLKTGLFADRCSSNLFGANALRLRFSAFAHILHNRVAAAAGGKLARAAPETLRLRLLKIGARVRMSVRRIHFALSGACPVKTPSPPPDEPRSRLTSGQPASGRPAGGEAPARPDAGKRPHTGVRRRPKNPPAAENDRKTPPTPSKKAAS